MDDLLGWQNTRWGMTDIEVIDSMPLSTFSRGPRVDYGTKYSELHIPTVKIGRHNFTVHMQMDMKTQRLGQVMLRCEGDPFNIDKSIHAEALKVLTERFGKPVRDGTSDDLLWIFETTTIRLSTTLIEDFLFLVTLAFFPSSDRTGVILAF